MSWPAELEKQWRLLLKNLETSSHGFFLIEYDRLFTRDALLHRLQTEFESRQWQFEEIALSDDHLPTRLAADLCELPCKAIVVRLDGATADHFGALNLARKALYDLPTNILFLTSQETHTRFLTSAHDLATWVHIPYSFALPETDIPKLPSLLPNIPNTLAERIRYYEDQIRRAVEQSDRQKAFRLLSPLADLYLDAAMYNTAYQIYQALATYYEQMTDERQAFLFSRRRDTAQSWGVLADLHDGNLLLPEDRIGLKKLLDDKILSVQKTSSGFAVVDEMGHSMSFPLPSPALAVLGALSDDVATEVVRAPEEKGERLDSRARLRQALTTHFSAEELRTLCFDLGVDYENLAGEGKADTARELVAHLERHGRIPDLIAIASKQRPNVSWGDVFKVTGKALSPDKLTSLRQDIVYHLGDDELRQLCSIIGLDYADFSAPRKADTVRKLVAYLEYRNRIPELVKALAKQRPDVSWDGPSIGAGDKVTIGENVSVKLAPANASDSKALQRALTMARRTLAILEEQANGYTALTIPVHLRIELEEKRRQVTDLETQLQSL